MGVGGGAGRGGRAGRCGERRRKFEGGTSGGKAWKEGVVLVLGNSGCFMLIQRCSPLCFTVFQKLVEVLEGSFLPLFK